MEAVLDGSAGERRNPLGDCGNLHDRRDMRRARGTEQRRAFETFTAELVRLAGETGNARRRLDVRKDVRVSRPLSKEQRGDQQQVQDQRVSSWK